MRKTFLEWLDGIILMVTFLSIILFFGANFLMYIDLEPRQFYCLWQISKHSGIVTVFGLAYSIISNAAYLVKTAILNRQSLKEAIPSDHGDDLVTVMEALRNEKREYSAVFDASGHKLAEGTLQSPTKCNIPVDMWERVLKNVHTDLHNHPGMKQVSFSPSDLYILLDDSFPRAIIVTRDYNYVMENPWWNREDGPSALEVSDYMERLGRFGDSVGTLSPFWCQYHHYVAYCVAKKYGLKYRREEVHPTRTKIFFRHVFTKSTGTPIGHAYK